MMAKPIPLHFTDENFRREVLEADDLTVVGFSRSKSVKKLRTALGKLACEFNGVARFGQIDIANNLQTAALCGVGPVPEFLFFQDGTVVDRMGEEYTPKDLANFVRELLDE